MAEVTSGDSTVIVLDKMEAQNLAVVFEDWLVMAYPRQLEYGDEIDKAYYRAMRDRLNGLFDAMNVYLVHEQEDV